MYLLKLIAIVLLVLIIWNGFFILRFLKGVFKDVKQFREQASNYQNGNARQGTTVNSSQKKKKIIPRDEGEYVDFEEVE